MKKKRIVVKVGTSTLTQGGKKLSRKYMVELTKQLAKIHAQEHQVILVTSGAVAAGRELLHQPILDRFMPSKQMFAAIGQVQLMRVWTELFSLFDIHVGQVLLTRNDLSNRTRYLNTRDTLDGLLSHKIIPIINENDTLATRENRVGDNDNLAALVANLVGADLLVLLTDQEGLYTADPRHDPNAELITTVKHIDDHILSLAKGSSTSLGTGGMKTKIEAAQKASYCGTPTVIASSSIQDVLLELCEGKQIGTTFHTSMSLRESRKRWLLAEQVQGTIHIDEGAASKILRHGASLLPSGVLKAVHTFDRGTVVQIEGPSEKPLAVGITNYGSAEIAKLAGIHSKRIKDVLGYSRGVEIVNRTNMARITSCGEEDVR